MTTADEKRNAMAFYDLMFNGCRPREAMDRYAGDEYIQHNPHVGDGRVVEHWDVLQVIPDESKNDNGTF